MSNSPVYLNSYSTIILHHPLASLMISLPSLPSPRIFPPAHLYRWSSLRHLMRLPIIGKLLRFCTCSLIALTVDLSGIFQTVSLTSYPLEILQSIVNQTTVRMNTHLISNIELRSFSQQYYGQSLALKSASFISYDVEPFLPTLFSHNTSDSAYPPSRSQGLLPLNLYYAWSNPLEDAAIQQAVRDSAALLKSQAVAAGQDVANAAMYGNYAIFDTPLELIYGDNLPRLQSIKATYDPTNVMGLAGGYKF